MKGFRKPLAVYASTALLLFLSVWALRVIISALLPTIQRQAAFILIYPFFLAVAVMLTSGILRLGKQKSCVWIALFGVIESLLLQNFFVLVGNAVISSILFYLTIVLVLLLGNLIYNAWQVRLVLKITVTAAIVVLTGLASIGFFVGVIRPYLIGQYLQNSRR